jgi:signal transduction histidine kinase
MTPVRDWPLRRKLVALLWSMSVATLLLTALISLAAQALIARRQVIQDLEAQAQVLAENLVAALDFTDVEAASETLASLTINRDLLVACAYDANGVLFAAFQPREPCPAEPMAGDTALHRASVRVVRAVGNARRLGTLTLATSLDAVYRQLVVQAGILSALLVCLVPLGLVVSRRLESLASRRILRLTEAASRIAAARPDNLDAAPVPVESRDEIGRLTETFNDMVSRLARQASALRTANAELELRVAKRTHELAVRNAELIRANQDLEDFAYITSHDLKEPLRGIQHYAGFIIEDYAEAVDDAGRDKMGTLVRLAARMEGLIDSLLHYSRVGHLEISAQPVDIKVLVQEVCDSLAVTIEKSGAAITLGELTPVRCDPERIAEVYSNLIVNALKYNDKSDKLLYIGSHRDADGHPTFHVRDNGIGIADKHRDAVFRIFKRLHSRDTYGGGVGAGLTIVRKIVERHGGRVWIESEPLVGTTVFFTVGPETTDVAT